MHEPLWYPQQRRLHPRDLEETDYFAKDHQASDFPELEHPLARDQHEHHRQSSQ